HPLQLPPSHTYSTAEATRLPRSISTDPAPTETYTLSLHDALPIFPANQTVVLNNDGARVHRLQYSSNLRRRTEMHTLAELRATADRKSTRLNSSHVAISYAVFCLKKKTRCNTTQESSTQSHPASIT